MSVDPLTRLERYKLQDPRRWGVTHQRWEATVQAETARADAAEERAERLVELLRMLRPQLSDVDVRVVDEALADGQAEEER